MGEGGEVSSGEVEDKETCSVYELKRTFKYIVDGDDNGLDGSPPTKKKAKEAVPSEDVCSGILDSVLSNEEIKASNSRSSSRRSPRVDSDADNRVTSGDEMTSTTVSSGSATTGSSVYNDGRKENCSDLSIISDVVLEVPKNASSTGIRKITFKFSKVKKEPEDGGLSASSFSNNGTHEGDSYRDFCEEGCYGDMMSRVSRNKELKMSKKVVLDTYPSNVKKLLSTGILEGARVKYISATQGKEIPGIVRGYRYLCGCSTCNFSNVVSAYEFELHAGAITKHANNHIYLENGRSMYSIIEELKTAPPGMFEEVVKDFAGSSYNEGSFHAWRDLQKKPVRSSRSLASCRDKGAAVRPELRSSEDNMFSEHLFFATNSIEGSKHPANVFDTHATNLLVSQRKESGAKRRDNDLHRLLFMRNGLPDGAELAYYVKGQKFLKGYKRGSGIVCGHCDCEISPSQFEAHAGWGARRQPYRHIYTSNGITLHDIATSLQNGQKVTSGQSDDMCTVCGEQEGELTLCNGCPRAYHAACLGSEYVTREDDRRCPCCCGGSSVLRDSSHSTTRPIIVRLTRVVKPVETETGGCVICRRNYFSGVGFDDHTVIICDQCEKEYHIGCLRDNGICDLKELPANKWFCSGDCRRIHVSLVEHFLKGAQLLPSSVFEALNKKLAEKRPSGMDENDVQWLLISGKNPNAVHAPLLSKAASIFRECFNPIATSSGRDLIPVMVYGRNISGQDFENMYTVVLIVNSVVVSAALLRVFSSEVAELPLVATSKENQGKGYFQALFACMERFLSSLKVQNLVLPAAEEAKSIWTNKFGFRPMSQEQLSKYTRDLTLTGFQGSYWLEKALGHQT